MRARTIEHQSWKPYKRRDNAEVKQSIRRRTLVLFIGLNTISSCHTSHQFDQILLEKSIDPNSPTDAGNWVVGTRKVSLSSNVKNDSIFSSTAKSNKFRVISELLCNEQPTTGFGLSLNFYLKTLDR